MVINKIDAGLYKQMIFGAASALQLRKEDVNRLNVFPVPDGDTGTNMYMTIDGARSSNISGNTISEISEAVAKAVMRSARGNSGVILSLFFRGLAKGFAGHSEANPDLVVEAFRIAAEEARKAVLKPVEGTILTVMRDCCSESVTLDKSDIISLFNSISFEAQEVLKKTPEMLPVLKKAKVVDSGGYGFTIVLNGMITALNGEHIDIPLENTEISDSADFSMFNDEEITFSFCTECLANRNPETTQEQVDELRVYLDGMGDSVVLVSDEEIIKVHVHTNEPLEVLGNITKLGVPQFIKVENMRLQHNSLISNTEAETENSKAPYGVITVANGDGLVDLFKEVGANYVVAGGQSMNPSTNDFLKAIKAVNAENVIILPNNSNIVLTAIQAAEICDFSHVEVIKTVTIPQGISALISFDSMADLQGNLEAMKESAEMVTTLTITRAVKDAVIDDLTVAKKQFIGLVDKDLKYVNDNLVELVKSMCQEILEKETITVFYGKGVDEEEAIEVSDAIKSVLGDYCEIEIVKGDQPVYPFIISAE